MAETKRRNATPAKKAKTSRAKAAPADDASLTDSVITQALANITLDEARTVPETSIAQRAYQRWIERGRPLSDGREDWFAARAELQP